MRHPNYMIIWIAVLSSVSSNIALSQITNGKSPVVWERQFGGDDVPYTQGAIAVLPKRPGVAFCAPSSGGSSPKTFALWRVSTEGQVLKQDRIPGTLAEKSAEMIITTRPWRLGMGDGHVTLAIKSDSGQTVLLEQDEQGATSSIRDLLLPKSVVIERIVRDSGNNVLMVGYLDNDAFAMKLGPHGDELWRGTFDHGKRERFTSAIPCADGGAC